VATASTGALPAPPERPGWWPVVLGVFLGYVCAAFVLFGVSLVAVVLGLVPWNEPRVSDAVLSGPYAVDGAWSVAANAAVAFTVVALASWVVARVLERRLDEPVSLPLVFAVLGVTGYVPYLALEGRFRPSGLLALVVAAGLIRWLAVGDARAALAAERARARLIERGWWRRLVVAGAVAWAAALAVATSYGLAHPLTSGYAVDSQPASYVYQRIGDRQYHVFRGPPGTEGSYTFDFRNAGFADLTVQSVELPEGFGFELAGFSLSESFDGPAASVVGGRDSAWLDLRLRLVPCEGAGLTALREVRIRYTVLGRAQSQLLPLTPAPAVRCG
jgi:hypothetical protein